MAHPKLKRASPLEWWGNPEYAPDVVCVDPPRKGCDEQCLRSIVLSNAKKVVYVSCDLSTLARDLCYLSQNGYAPKKACIVDMFP